MEQSCNKDNMIIEDFDSSITADEVFTKLAKAHPEEIEENSQSENNSTKLDEQFDLLVLPQNEKETDHPSTPLHPIRRITRTIPRKIPVQDKGTFLAKAHSLFVAAVMNIG